MNKVYIIQKNPARKDSDRVGNKTMKFLYLFQKDHLTDFRISIIL